VAHGYVARMLGDPTAAEMKRLSLNPLRHVDLFGTIILPAILKLSGAPVFGWAKPVPVNIQRLRNPRLGMMLVAAAGPGTNLVLALLAAVGLGLMQRLVEPSLLANFVFENLKNFLVINIFLALFNLLPLPPFDGSHIVEGLLPRQAAQQYARLRPYGFPLLILLLVVIPWLFPGLGIVENIVVPPVQWLHDIYIGVANAIALS
jgi:Zn-dependent protease